jgi:hypothetical protein
MSRITYHTKGVCSMQITFHIENGILLDVEFLNVDVQ